MRAAQGGWNQVDVAFGDGFTTLRQPGQRPVRRFALAADVADERRIGQQRRPAQRLLQIISEAILVMPGDLFAGRFVGERDFQPRTQHRFGAQDVLEPGHGKLGRIKIARIRPEPQGGAGRPARRRADLFQIGRLVAAGEGHVVLLAVALDPDFEMTGQRVHYRHADPVQAAGEAVVAVGELAAGVQAGQDQFDAGNALFGVQVHRHPAPIVGHRQRTVGVQNHLHNRGVAGKRFVHAVVNHFLSQVIRPAGVGIHSRPLANRVQAAEDFNRSSVVGRSIHAESLGLPIWARTLANRRGGVQSEDWIRDRGPMKVISIRRAACFIIHSLSCL